MDFVSLWKVASIAFTALFGAIGLVKDLKDKVTGRVTAWGYLSLFGIVISATLGIVSQTKEIMDAESAKSTAASLSMQLIRNTNDSVSEIRRLMTRMGRPVLYVDMVYTCDQTTKTFCEEFRRRSRTGAVEAKNIKLPNNPALEPMLRIDFFRSKSDFEKTLVNEGINSDLVWEVNPDYSRTSSDNLSWKNQIDMNGSMENKQQIDMNLIARNVAIRASNGVFIGATDLVGSYIIVFGLEKNVELKAIRIDAETNISFEFELVECAKKTHPKFDQAGQPTIFNHLGEATTSCKIGLIPNLTSTSR